MRFPLLYALAFVLGNSCTADAAPSRAPPLVLRGATVLDGLGGAPLADGTIVIEAGRILSIGRSAEVRVPVGARTIDLKGKFVIPGLMDGNVHLDLGFAPEYLFAYDGRYDELILEAAQVALKSGVTTVFDTWGPRGPLVSVRDAINDGRAVGSRMFIAGNIIGTGGPTSADFLQPVRGVINEADADRIDAMWEQGVGPELLWMTPEEVREKVRAYIASGRLDFVKYLSSGHKDLQFIAFSPDAQRVIVEEAHRAGLKVQAHSTSPESLKLAIQAGVDLLTHCDISGLEPIPQATIDHITARRLPCSPLLMTTRYYDWTMGSAPALYQELIKAKDQNDRRLIAAGAVLILATDAGIPGPKGDANPLLGAMFTGAKDLPTRLGDAHFLWIKAAVERGMAPMAALSAATRNVAEAYGTLRELGTLEVGKRADLIVLSADPLSDPDNYRRIVDVYKDGTRVDREHLPTKHLLTPP